MPNRRSLLVAFGLVAALAGRPAVAAQTSPPPKTAVPDPMVMAPMVFFEAHGEANACGPGCSEWIAAVGKIDAGTADRLRSLLTELNGARPPIFFYSPGGQVTGSMELGQLIRERKMTVSVGHTVLLNCARDAPSQKSCIAQIGAHRRVEAELDQLTAMCNSACVYALAGGAVRLIPPWVSLGIHDIAMDPATAALHSAAVNDLGELTVSVRLATYLQKMGIDNKLLTEAFAVPHTTLARLSRDDAARFGVDRRAFAETEWTFVKTPFPAVRKSFFVRTTTGRPHFIDGFVNLTCMKGSAGSYILAYVREHLPDDSVAPAVQPPVIVDLNEKPIAFYPVVNDKAYIRSAKLSTAMTDDMPGVATIVLPGAEFGRQPGPEGDITLRMAGFATAYAKLPDACAQILAAQTLAAQTLATQTLAAQTAATTAQAGQSAYLAQSRGPLPSPTVASAELNAQPPNPGIFKPLPLGALKPGVKRAEVDATIGAPTRVIGTTAFYSYTSSDNERKVLAGYFDKSGRLQRLARYALKNGQVVDEIGNTELTLPAELFAVRALLGPETAGSGMAMPAAKIDPNLGHP